MPGIDAKEYLGKKTLILGEVNSGKTFLTREAASQLANMGHKIAVIDLAPKEVMGIGGKIEADRHWIHSYFTADIIAPRMSAQDIDEAEHYALQNARIIDKLFDEYLESLLEDPCKVLVINDVTIYLQAGDFGRLLEIASFSHTCIMNGYYGTSLGQDRLSRRERQNTEELSRSCDEVILLNFSQADFE